MWPMGVVWADWSLPIKLVDEGMNALSCCRQGLMLLMPGTGNRICLGSAGSQITFCYVKVQLPPCVGDLLEG